jgi:hypothetical protein
MEIGMSKRESGVEVDGRIRRLVINLARCGRPRRSPEVNMSGSEIREIMYVEIMTALS